MTDRGVSDVIGYVLIFSLVAATVGIVSVSGVSVLQDARDAEQISNAERAFDVLADNLEDIYRDGAPSRATEMSLSDAAVSTHETARLNISGDDGTALQNLGDIESTVLVWESSGDPPTKVVYSFGVVLRSQRDGGLVKREGPFQFDSDRTILPLVQTRAASPQSLGGGTIRVRGTRSDSSIIHRGDGTQFSSILINVTTDHGTAWQNYLDSKNELTCSTTSLGPDRSRVECEMSGPDELYVTFHPINIELER